MSAPLVISIIFIYFFGLLGIASLTAKQTDTRGFFVANRQSPWYLVAFGMIGSSLSGVTFISIPGAVYYNQFSYFQVVLGYLVGYAVIALVLMPLYYRLNLISIYGYLEQRFGTASYRTGAWFFLLSRLIGAAFRLFLAAMVLHIGIFKAWHVPFELTVVLSLFLIWIYTFRGGIKTIVWTDTLQTAFMLLAVGMSIYLIWQELGWSWAQLSDTLGRSGYTKVFFWDDWTSPDYFLKQFWSGAFLALVMTGLDQDMMQKNLTCRTLQDAQKNVFWFSLVLVVVNFAFLLLGALLYVYAQTKGITLPTNEAGKVITDNVYPMLAFNHFGVLAGVCFLLGIVSATYSSADSALTALTTSFTVDILDAERRLEEADRKRLVRRVHIGMAAVMALVMIVFNYINDQSVIQSLFKVAGFTYGPLLGLYAFGLMSKRPVHDRWVPLVCVLAPVFCILLNQYSAQLLWGYKFGFEILIVNGMLTFLGLWAISYPQNTD
ncbi:sodium:solute symporter [Eisenibacter elegans]|jgi:SSS family transporter|uniref:sodium:solute symporter n=1 Tax=Eisenibacter elegans TaxID=997 RepID=UPI00041B6458|nr:sodium:solute symporter [Eisenibacter elegans]